MSIYKPEIDAVNGRDTPITFQELHERLLNREAMLLCKEDLAPAGPITVNVADARSKPPNQNNNWRQNNNRNNNNQTSYHANSNSQSSYQGNNNSRGSRTYLGRCQACGTQGHSAKYCPEYRIVRGSGPQWQQPQRTQPWQNINTHQSWQPRANVALTNGSDASTWLFDSGASHHMTSDLTNLSLHSPYNGGEEVILGDGSSQTISHTGQRSEYGGAPFGRPT